ncbi:small ribosomal subunit Rsm22 family protein [Maridesulfovibrio hydrothermalis]|uniref:Ribosomal small subunit Rsm22 n=1 Tax=Maridesulfovibrio hydrothermalis AM13 = DSM 14728 TaxID=1121451 RepID=L0RCK8_9BACT|nr:small ribosomal subunit Rsm22 family protein [Maridesulfovibrio hydrothermalis]CCO23915.1 Ribosomal small subunit Rsm22 [Maridesulfovibrio hydrothermalis AM13 = DSM 14728]
MSIKVSSLFPLPPAEITKKLENYLNILDKAVPLRSKHKTELPYAIRDLSKALTGERSSLPKDYMGDPRSLNAYLRYFLPWNLYRLSRLFQGLDINLPDNGIIIDLGAGPLTVAQALWIARPDLREKKLTFINVDRSPKPMREGAKLFEALASKSPWRMVNVKGGPSSKIRERANLLVTANMVNEAASGMKAPLPVWSAKFCQHISRMLAPEGKMLIIEPGIRRSGRTLSVMRNEFIEKGYSILAPCPHEEECPMTAEHGKPWCHFNFDSNHSPVWLQKLSARCRLEKDNVSLSFLYVGQPGTPSPVPHEGEMLIRAITDSFRIDDGGYGQYACGAEGLLLLLAKGGARSIFPGGLLGMPIQTEMEEDLKSGAMIVELPTREKHKLPREDAPREERKTPRKIK